MKELTFGRTKVILKKDELITTALFVLAWVIGCVIGTVGGLWWFE